jgi:hypothetical protein
MPTGTAITRVASVKPSHWNSSTYANTAAIASDSAFSGTVCSQRPWAPGRTSSQAPPMASSAASSMGKARGPTGS